MTVFDSYFPMGLGTSRFPISGPDDIAGIEKSVALVVHALRSGVNYIDTSYMYSAGMAQTVLKEAFRQAAGPYAVTVKVMGDMDKTADDACRRVEMQLKTMGVDKARFFVCWFIHSYEQFLQLTEKGGVYDGALRLKASGTIDHICFSAHAQNPDIIRMLESGAFEGMTLSYNMLNAAAMQEVLNTALKHRVGVAAMNPLGGGTIPNNAHFFDFASCGESESATSAALRFVKAHPAVRLVLSGVSSVAEFDENLKAFTEPNPEADEERIARVRGRISEIKGYCTGCDYCAGCPAEIPISELMKKRNALVFGSKLNYRRTDTGLLQNLALFYSHTSAGEWFPPTDRNPCTRCAQCERKCTQKLNIMDSIADMYRRAGRVGFNLAYRKRRLEALLLNKGYKRVGLYPNGGNANLIVGLYERFFGRPGFEWLQFNSDPKMWGQLSGGLRVHSPGEIAALGLDAVIVCSYNYDSEIYESLRRYKDMGVEIFKLHRETDVPWVF
jgi:predicted aldo/keto reductase-like oxidoreductase